ncbi:MAG: hypothetical protein QOD81_4693 [Solirubrobacteraceae bacterium]|nr:hypothetical protein [Solirubrobacteraceae bacterium]
MLEIGGSDPFARCALLSRSVLDHDPGEPEYVEPVALTFAHDGSTAWRFRGATAAIPV